MKQGLDGILEKCDEILDRLRKEKEMSDFLERFTGKHPKNIKKLKNEAEEKLLKLIIESTCSDNAQVATQAYLNFKNALSFEDSPSSTWSYSES